MPIHSATSRSRAPARSLRSAGLPGVGLLGVGLLALGAAPALAAPQDTLPARLAERICRVEGLPCVLGRSDHGRLRQAERMLLADGASETPGGRRAAVEALLGPELRAAGGAGAWWVPPAAVEPLARIAGGDRVPWNLGGDEEPGLLSLRGGAEARAYPGIGEVVLAPELRLDLLGGPVDGGVALREAWAGVATHGLVAGFGLRDRHLGPGRWGSLMLGSDARPAPLGTLSWTSPAGPAFGRVHGEVGAGWLTGERRDVQRPGWLLMDLRWLALAGVDGAPGLELGLSRVGIFGGEGRPAPPIGQLLLPTDPHVYDDPDRVEPDQDEMAAVDVRLCLPLGRWAGIGATPGRVDGLDYVELWIQHGGEDVIARELGPLPYPSLAGVANLVGGEVAAGPVVLTGEHARILDDYFRWYTGHRVYHDGYTQDGRVLGHGLGGDAMGWYGGIAWEPGPWAAGVELAVERRVGVVEALGDNLLALAVDEERTRVGLWGLARTRLPRLGPTWWRSRVEVERIRGGGYTPGPDSWAVRVAVGR